MKESPLELGVGGRVGTSPQPPSWPSRRHWWRIIPLFFFFLMMMAVTTAFAASATLRAAGWTRARSRAQLTLDGNEANGASSNTADPCAFPFLLRRRPAETVAVGEEEEDELSEENEEHAVMADFARMCQLDYHQLPYLCDLAGLLSRTESELLDRQLRALTEGHNATGCLCAESLAASGGQCSSTAAAGRRRGNHRRREKDSRREGMRILALVVPNADLASTNLCARRRNAYAPAGDSSEEFPLITPANTFPAATELFARLVLANWRSCEPDLFLVYVGRWQSTAAAEDDKNDGEAAAGEEDGRQSWQRQNMEWRTARSSSSSSRPFIAKIFRNRLAPLAHLSGAEGLFSEYHRPLSSSRESVPTPFEVLLDQLSGALRLAGELTAKAKNGKTMNSSSTSSGTNKGKSDSTAKNDKATKKKPSRWKKKSKKNGTENSEEIDDDDEEEEDTVLGGVPRWAIVLSGMLILVVLVVMFIGTVVLNTDIHNAQKRRPAGSSRRVTSLSGGAGRGSLCPGRTRTSSSHSSQYTGGHHHYQQGGVATLMGVRIGGGRKHAGLAGAQSVPASSGGTMMWRQFSRRSKQRRYNQSCKTTLQKI